MVSRSRKGSAARRRDVQIQDAFSGKTLATLAVSGLEVYDFIPDYRRRCPLCSGPQCAVRHGLYRRCVVDADGSIYPAFPIPRFRCRQRGDGRRGDSTFSVLPADLASRRRLCLPLMLWMMDLLLDAGRSIRDVLDAFGELLQHQSRPWFPDPPVIYRVLHLFAAADRHVRLRPRDALPALPGASDVRRRAARVFRYLGVPSRAAPRILAYHQRRFPALFFLPQR